MDDLNQKTARLAELMDLVTACREGTATDDQQEKLREMLQSSPVARQAYVELMHLENTLSYHLGGAQRAASPSLDSLSVTAEGDDNDRQLALAGVRSIQQLQEERNAKAWSLERIALAGTLASCLIAVGWLIGWASHPESDNPTVATSSESDSSNPTQPGKRDSLPLAAEIVSYSPGANWGLMNLAVMPGGTSLRPGQPVQLQSGTAKIRFANGGVVVLQGPSVLEVESGEGGHLRSGKATLIALHGSGPVKLTTPSNSLVVRNAELGIVVNETDGTSDVCVLAGNVEMALLNDVGIEMKRETIAEGFVGRFHASQLEMLRTNVSKGSFVREVPEAYIAYHNLLGFPGDQLEPAFDGVLGMDFVVKDPIEVTKLGVFDSDADGLNRTITAELWSRNEAGTAYRFDDDYGGDMLAREVFSQDDPGELIESSRFKSLRKPLRLKPGAYTIVAYGYGKSEPNGNEGDRFRILREGDDLVRYRKSLAHKTLDDGRGAILFVGSARFDHRVGVFPAVVDPGSVNRYRAGTFEFKRVTPTKASNAARDFSI